MAAGSIAHDTMRQRRLTEIDKLLADLLRWGERAEARKVRRIRDRVARS